MSGRFHLFGFGMLIACCSITSLANPLWAQEDSVPEEPTLIVRITPPKPYLQEEIVQVVRVIAPHPFEELVLDLPPVAGAEVITLQKPKNRKFETYGGEGYIYETSRAIFPKQSGELLIPPVRISGSIGISRNERKPFALRHDGRILDVRPPPESFSEDWWLVARDVEVDEDWSVPLDQLRVGDRVTRSITITVAGATGAHLPELEQGRANGITVLPGRTERSTKITPAGVIGKISRSFDIRVDVDQPINISPVRMVWWNTSTEIERRSAAPAVRLEPLPRDVEKLVAEAMADAAAAHRNGRNGLIALTLGAGMLLIALAFWFFRTRLNVRPEDRSLQRALSNDSSPIDAIRALKRWAATAFPGEPTTLDQLGRYLGADAEVRIARLQQAAFGRPTGSVDAASLALDVVRIARQRQSQTTTDIIGSLTDRLLGPERRLPELDGTSKG